MARNSTTAPRAEGVAAEARPEGVAKDNAPHAVAYRLGVMFLQEGKYNEAIPAFRKAILIKPDFADARCGLGLALSDQQLFPQAIAAFREAIKIAPDFAGAYYWLGDTLIKSRQFPEAAAAFREAVKITPHNAEAQYALGSALAMAGQPSDAIGAFVEARKLTSDIKAQQRITVLLKQLGYKEQVLNKTARIVVESKEPGYTGDAPPSEAAVTPPLRMRDDLNKSLNAAVKVARTEILARLVDLDNPALSDAERLTRATRLVRSYQRRRAENPNYEPSREVLDAFSIINKASYQRSKARKAAQKNKLAM